MRFFTGLIFMVQCVFGGVEHYLDVKDDNVILKINGDEKSIAKGKRILLDKGDTVCYISGNGRLIVDEQRQLKNSNECFILPVNQDFNLDKFVSSMKSKAYIVFFDSTERVRHGASTKGSEIHNQSNILNLEKGQDLLISSNQFGPLPVKIQLYNADKMLVQTYVNESDKTTFLHLTHNVLSNGYEIKIQNGFGQLLMQSSIVIEK